MQVVAPPLLERAEALAAVEAIADVVNAGSGRVVYVEAGAGLGKTAVLDAYAATLAERGLRVLRAHGSELEHDFPFGIVRQLLAPVLRDAEVRDAVLAGAASTAAVLFAAGPGDGDHSRGVDPFEMMHALYWALANLCDLGPVAVLVDDAHEIDAPSLRFCSFLARRLIDLPLLLVIAARPVPDSRTHSPSRVILSGVDAHLVQLSPLSQEAVSAVLRDRLGQEPGPAFVAACEHATGGNPFYLRELIRAVDARGVAEADAGTAPWLAELGPAAVVDRLRNRIAALPPAALPVVRACAVLGEDARLSDCAELAQVSPDDAATAADALVREGILVGGTGIRFLHPILQAAVLTDLGEHSRRRWHARAARVLDRTGGDPQVIAAHLLRTDPAGDDRMCAVLIRAGQSAAMTGSPVLAAQFLRRASDECPDGIDADLLYELGSAEYSIGQAVGLEHMALGVRNTADPVERAGRVIRLANFQMRSGDLVEAVDMLGQAREGLADEELLLGIDAARYWAGRLHPATRDESRHLGDRLRAAVDGAADTPARRTVLAYLACEAAQSESAAEAGLLFDRALAAPGLLHFVPFDSVAAQAAMLSLLAVERHADFEQLTDSVLGEAGRRGALLPFLVASTFRTLALLRAGDLGGAETEAREALRSSAEQGWEQGAAGLVALRSLALLEEGDRDGAHHALAATGSMLVAPGFPTALVHSARGRLLAEEGDLAGGIEALLECGRTLLAMGIMSPGVVPWRSEAAVLLAVSGELDRARELAHEECGLARRLAGPVATARALHALAQTTRGGERIALLREARELLAHAADSLTYALITVDLGATLRRAKQPADARTYLREGLEIAARCRCTPLAGRAREELTVLGAAPRRMPGYGPESLTPSEVRVARLAAQGRTNPEIAQRLFVTRKTVEKHLASAYRKLGIESRAQLDIDQLADPMEP